MTITKRFWRTRDGRKAEVVDVCGTVAIGWLDSNPFYWNEKGTTREPFNCTTDLIEPWIEKPEWDWSTTPPWMNWLAMDDGGFWYLHDEMPECRMSGWCKNNCWYIPEKHRPKWSGDWKESLVSRPGVEVKP